MTAGLSKLFGSYGVFARWGKMLAACVFLSGPAMAGAHSTTGPVVVAFGDSLTQGYGLFEDDGFVPQLRRWLAENGAPPLRVVNAGVSGDTSAGGLSRIGWTLTPDVDAIIVALGGNDMLRGINPEVTRNNLDLIIEKIKNKNIKIILTGMLAQQSYGTKFNEKFNSIYPDLAKKHKISLYPFLLEGIALNPSLNLEDRKHPNAKGVEIIAEGLYPLIKKEILNK